MSAVSPEVKRSRKIAVVLATSTIVSILFFIYGFLQKLEADKQREEALQYRMVAESSKADAVKARDMAIAAQIAAEQQRIQAATALEECMKSKR